MPYPILAPRDTWYTQGNSGILRSTITEIHIRDSYTPTGPVTAQWDGSAAKDGSITVFVEGTVLTIAGNGSGKIRLSQDASRLFSGGGMDKIYTNVTIITGLPLLDVSSCTSLRDAFSYCLKVKTFDLTGWDTSSLTSIYGIFRGNPQIGEMAVESIPGLENFKTDNLANMEQAFYLCTSLTQMDLSRWNVSNVTTMSRAFCNDALLKTVGDLSNWRPRLCENFNGVFGQCPMLGRRGIELWDVSSGKYFSHMLADNFSLSGTLDLSGWDMSNALDVSALINDCNQLEYLNVMGWNTKNVKAFGQFAERCTKLRKIIGLECLDTSAASTITSKEFGTQDAFGETFSGCESMRELDLGNLSTVSAFLDYNNTMHNMLDDMIRLEKLTLGPNFDVSGSDPVALPLLPTPDPDYIPGADGHWYDKTGKAYTPEEAIKVVPNTYYASKAVLYGPEPAVMDRAQMREIAEYVRQATGLTGLMQIPGVMKAVVDFAGKKLDATALPSAIDTALAQAKASGAFDGKDGAAGRSIAWGTLAAADAVSDTHVTIANIIKNHTRIAAPVKNAAAFKARDLALLPGQYNDSPRQHYWMLFDVDKVVGSQLQGYPLSVIEEGLPGAKGETPKKGTDYWTEADREAIVRDTLAALPAWKWEAV